MDGEIVRVSEVAGGVDDVASVVLLDAANAHAQLVVGEGDGPFGLLEGDRDLGTGGLL